MGRAKLGASCKVCGMPERDLVQLDLLLSTPPEEIDAKLFGDLGVVPPDLPAEWKRFGALRKAQLWLEERGYAFTRQTLVAHFNQHLPAVWVSDSDRALQTGRLSDGTPAPTAPEPLKMAIEYHAFFKMGLQAGFRALEMLVQRLEAPEAPSNALLLQIAHIGKGLAQAQAAIVTKGMRFVMEDDDAIGGFMGEDETSPRFGAYRVRTIEGKRVPVHDEGPADRREYNERAREEGSVELPAP